MKHTPIPAIWFRVVDIRLPPSFYPDGNTRASSSSPASHGRRQRLGALLPRERESSPRRASDPRFAAGCFCVFICALRIRAPVRPEIFDRSASTPRSAQSKLIEASARTRARRRFHRSSSLWTRPWAARRRRRRVASPLSLAAPILRALRRSRRWFRSAGVYSGWFGPVG